MATSASFKDYILEQLSLLDGIRCRPMMGEFLLYYKECLFGGIYNSRLLVKITEHNKNFGLEEAIPYKGAKLMFKIPEDEDKEIIKQIVLATYNDLLKTKKK